MKFLLFGLIFATALYSSSAATDLKADLLAKAAGLLTKSGPLIALLESQGKPLLVEGLKAAEKVVIDIETKLKNADPKTEIGKLAVEGLEVLLKSAETKLEEEVKKLSGTFYAEDLQTTLLTKAAELLTKSGPLIALLEGQGKPLLAEGLKAIEKYVIEIETKVKNSHPSSAIGKLALEGLEALLKFAETQLEAEVKKLSGTFYAEDLQTTLLTKAAELLTKSGPLIALLEGQGKPLLAEGLKVIEKFVIEIETKVQNSHPSSAIGKLALEGLEALLKFAETQLEAEVKKLSGTATLYEATFYEASYYEDLQITLLTKAAELLTKSGPLIALLEGQGKPLLAEGLKVIEKFVIEIETKVQNSHPSSATGKLALEGLEALLKFAETQLEAEVKKFSGTFYAEDLQTTLLTKAAEFLTKSGPLIALLEGQGKPLLAEGLKVIEKFVIEIETKVQNSHPSSAIGKLALEGLEALLKFAETQLEAEVKKLSGTFYAEDLQTTLLAKAAELLTKSNGLISLLESQGKPLLAEGLKAVEKVVIDIETKLKNANPKTEIGKLAVEGLEVLLKSAETKLEEEVKKLSAAF